MAKLESDITDATLLCERCGYVLEGLNEDGACPECGQKIAESLPSRRTGTPFQVYGDYKQLLRHTVMLFRQPTALFNRMWIGRDAADDVILNRSCMATALWLGLAMVLYLWGPMTSAGTSPLALLPLALGFSLCCWLGLLSLTWVERLGVVFFSRKRGWRVSKSVSRAVCANASPAWLAAGLLTSFGSILAAILLQVSEHMSEPWWSILRTTAVALPFLGFIAGMLIFETLVYIGVRRCKYANWLPRPQVQPEPHPGESPAPD